MDWFVSVPLSKYDTLIDQVVGAGLHPEIRMTKADYLASMTPDDFKRMRDFFEKKGLRTFTHGPFFGLDIASLDRCLSEYSADCLNIGLEATSALGGKVMVMHTGYLPQFSRGGRRHWLRNWAERMPRIVEHADTLGITLAIENTWDDRPEILLHLAHLLGDGPIRFCLDTGHVNCFSRLPIERWWTSIGDRVAALHLHDNDGLSDDHQVPGTGTFDFKWLMTQLRHSKILPLMDLELDLSQAEKGRSYFELMFQPARL